MDIFRPIMNNFFNIYKYTYIYNYINFTYEIKIVNYIVLKTYPLYDLSEECGGP